MDFQLKSIETAQLFSISISILSLAWCFSEYNSTRKNMLLDITESPCSRMIMCLYMLLQVNSQHSPKKPLMETFNYQRQAIYQSIYSWHLFILGGGSSLGIHAVYALLGPWKLLPLDDIHSHSYDSRGHFAYYFF